MGCNCKKKSVKNKVTGEITEKIVKRNVIVSSILFLLSVAISPLIYLLIIYVLFKHFFIGGSVDFTKSLTMFKGKKNIEEIEDVNLDDINPDEYELIDADDIKK